MGKVKNYYWDEINSQNNDGEIQIPTDDFALMAEEQAAAFIGVTRRSLQAWRINGNGPQYVKISARCVRYRRMDLIQWSEKRLQTSTSKDAFISE